MNSDVPPASYGRKNSRRANKALDLVKQRQAMDLYTKGADYDEIAKELKYANRSGAWKAVQRGLKTLTKQTQETAKKALKLDLVRLNKVLYGVARAGAFDGEVNPAKVALQVIERRASIFGYDAPKQVVEPPLRPERIEIVVLTDPPKSPDAAPDLQK